jgi:hypothetical protein
MKLGAIAAVDGDNFFPVGAVFFAVKKTRIF